MPIALGSERVDQLFAESQAQPDYRLTVDLERQLVTTPQGVEMDFEIDGFRRYCLLNGLDDIGLTMQKSDRITAFEQQYYEKLPWLR